jgi:hypothetical protein
MVDLIYYGEQQYTKKLPQIRTPTQIESRSRALRVVCCGINPTSGVRLLSAGVEMEDEEGPGAGEEADGA